MEGANLSSQSALQAAENLGRMSFKHRGDEPRRGRRLYPEGAPLNAKRSASSELNQSGPRQMPRLSDTANGSQERRYIRGAHAKHSRNLPVVYDSEYATRQNIIAEYRKPRNVSANGQILSMVLQPDSSPISTEELAAEVKGIYAGLVMVEAKCINIDAALAAKPQSPLGAEQWQALIAMHRSLLYEHHDFLMATQHPSATPALRGLANKYSMPARMWKHAIHAFLEILRHRRPQSQDYMLAFIYLAYQMMALLFESVPSFTDTWIECLGDLARYRMAIEEEKEAHAEWGGVAARWYTTASDRHPAIGRLYHHLGILERPSLRKFCYLSKVLTIVHPFSSARDSLATISGPIVQSEPPLRVSQRILDAQALPLRALVNVPDELESYTSPSVMLGSDIHILPTGRGNFGHPLQGLDFHGELSLLEAPVVGAEQERSGNARQLAAVFHHCMSKLNQRLMGLASPQNTMALSLLTMQHAAAAPTGVPEPLVKTQIAESGSTRFATIEYWTLQSAALTILLLALLNIAQIAVRKPKGAPKLSGDIAIGASLTIWLLVETAASAIAIRNVLLAFWLAMESNYVCKMLVVSKNGRVYFWSSVAAGLTVTLLAAALQCDGRPTFGKMVQAGLPSMAFFVSSAARMLPKVVGLT